jgi:hypothetical protein
MEGRPAALRHEAEIRSVTCARRYMLPKRVRAEGTRDDGQPISNSQWHTTMRMPAGTGHTMGNHIQAAITRPHSA